MGKIMEEQLLLESLMDLKDFSVVDDPFEAL